MKIWKAGLLFLAILSWSMVSSADRAAAEITNASQLVNIYGYSNTGVINSFSLVMPNGTLKPTLSLKEKQSSFSTSIQISHQIQASLGEN